MTERQKSGEKSLAELREALFEERRRVAPLMQGSRHGYTSSEEAELLAQIVPLAERQDSEQFENRSTIQILKDTASKCRLLETEADSALENGDSEGCKEKFVKRAQLIVDLPNQLTQAVDSKTLKGRQAILDEATSLSYLAEKALEPRGYFKLSVLLKPKGDKAGDLNPLESLIESIGE